MNWFQQVRFRVIAIVLGVLITGLAVASVSTMPMWPVLGATIAVFAVAVNTFGARLSADICYHCGTDLKDLPSGEHGVVCTKCGKLSFPATKIGEVAQSPDDSDESAEA